MRTLRFEVTRVRRENGEQLVSVEIEGHKWTLCAEDNETSAAMAVALYTARSATLNVEESSFTIPEAT